MCCGFRALEMDAGRVWKPLTTTRGGSTEKLLQKDKEVLLQAQDRDQTQVREFVVCVLSPGKSPVVDGGTGWASLGVPSRSHWPLSSLRRCRRQSCVGRSRASDQVCLSTRSSSVMFLLSRLKYAG